MERESERATRWRCIGWKLSGFNGTIKETKKFIDEQKCFEYIKKVENAVFFQSGYLLTADYTYIAVETVALCKIQSKRALHFEQKLSFGLRISATLIHQRKYELLVTCNPLTESVIEWKNEFIIAVFF